MKKVLVVMFLMALTFAFAEKSYAQASGIQIFVVDVSNGGAKSSIDIDATTTVSELKDKIRDQLGYEPERQRIVYAGVQLEDGKTLADYDIQHEVTVHLIIRLPNP